MYKVCSNIGAIIGKTPMFEFSDMKKHLNLKANVFGKCEFFNPSGSFYDRIAVSVAKQINNEKLEDDSILLGACEADFALSLAMNIKLKNESLMIVIPEGENSEKLKLIKENGAEIILTPKEDGIKGAKLKAEMLAQKSNKVILIEKYMAKAVEDANLLNLSTEILDDLSGQADVVLGIGLNNMKEVAKALISSNPDLYVVEVRAEKGSQWMQNDDTINAQEINEVIKIDDENAYGMARAIIKTTGLVIGVKSGAVMSGAVELANRKIFKDKNIVAILPDKFN